MKVERDFIWTQEQEDKVIRVGFTRRFIEARLLECFHILQADAQNLVEGGPMLVVETNDGLESIKSPVTGTIVSFNTKARNFPDRLTEDDVILKVLPKGIVLPAKEKKKKEAKVESETANQWLDNPFNIDWAQALEQARNDAAPGQAQAHAWAINNELPRRR